MYLGIDIGTSAIKAIIIDENDNVLCESRVGLEISRPHPLWSEQNPADWWSATNEAVTRLDTNIRKKVLSIGLSGQMHGAVLLNKARKVIRPAILWNDGRCAAECDEIIDKEPQTHEITGNLVMPGFTAPKLAWVKKHEPDNFREIDKVLLPKDYIRLRMTGEMGSDMSDASGTCWLDVAGRKWSDAMLATCGLTIENMPQLFEGNQQTGVLRDELAEAWGMNKIPVCAGGGDNAAGAVGVGVIHEGDALLSLGTSGVIFAATKSFRPNINGTVHAFCHALPNQWHQMSVMLSAASCLDWVANLTAQKGVGEMLASLEAQERFDTPEIFLPYLTGERTPHNNPNACGMFFGLNANTDATSLCLSVLHGVALGFADCLQVLRDAGTDPDTITVIGGGARSEFWGKILASSLNKPLVYRNGCDVGPSLGAARLARLCFGDITIEEVCVSPKVAHVIEPDRILADIMAHKQPKFRKLYKDTKNIL
jgi:xylulokinase